jgi:hypothetical protein
VTLLQRATSGDDARKRLTTYMLLGQMLREQEHPAQPELRLTRDGWEVHGGDYDHLPLPVNLAYEASGFDQRVLDETRKLCGDLRIPAKKNRTIRETLDALRAGLAEARKVKAEREARDAA